MQHSSLVSEEIVSQKNAFVLVLLQGDRFCQNPEIRQKYSDVRL
jgi:hypothetical protein